MKHTLLSLGMLVGSIALARDANASVITVGPSGASFTAIQPAVDAATDDDVILVRSGSYAGFTVTSKALSIVADVPGTFITSQVNVVSLSAAQTVHLSGFTLSAGTFGSVVNVLRLQNCQGLVRGQDLVLNGFLGAPAVVVTNCAGVSFVHCQLTGGNGYYIGQVPVSPGAGLSGYSATIALYDCSLTGGNGQSGMLFGTSMQLQGVDGAAGCLLSNQSVLFASGSTIHGGPGGSGAPGSCAPVQFSGTHGADGGSGLFVDAGCHADVLDDVFIPGAAGAGGGAPAGGCPSGGGASGVAGMGIAGTGTSTTWAGTHRGLRGTSPVRDLTTLTLQLSGEPGDRVYLATTSTPRHVLYPQFLGVELFGPNVRRTFLGVIPAGGTLSTPLPIPDIGLIPLQRYLQCVYITVGGQSVLSDPLTLVVLDSSF